MWSTLVAIRDSGGSATVDEILSKVVQSLRLTIEQQAVPHGGGPRTELDYRLAWARTYLKLAGAVENSSRGVWALTDTGRNTSEAELPALSKRPSTVVEPRAEDPVQDQWQQLVLNRLLAIPPASFERLAQRLLRESGFANVEVTGRGGDGGIDGVGVLRISLVGFPIVFQCKRHRQRVGPDVVRELRGAMAGRAEKGLLITTAEFTAEARREATRVSASPIELIDGSQLCLLLKQYGLGVTATARVMEDIQVDENFFDGL